MSNTDNCPIYVRNVISELMNEARKTQEEESVPLIRFDGLGSSARDVHHKEDRPERFPSAQVIEQLRQRLISPDHRDPVEVKVAILGEMTYFIYRELMKRRVL